MSSVEDIQTWLAAAPSVQDLKYQLRKLENIRDWAVEHIGIDYRVGDSVSIIVAPEISQECRPGWWIYRECLVEGARATVRGLDFSGGRWRAEFVLEREWSVSTWATETRRYWNGPEVNRPDGYQQGRKEPSLFTLDALVLAKADTLPLAAEPVRARVSS